jgi:hypothetical protein
MISNTLVFRGFDMMPLTLMIFGLAHSEMIIRGTTISPNFDRKEGYGISFVS